MTNLVELLEMKVLEQQEGYLKMEMPVSDKVKQPFGYLHGGATMALGETACSLGSTNLLDTSEEIPVGLEMSANHIKSAKEGSVIAEAKIIHQGRTTHVWDIRITDHQDNLISVMRGTLAIKKLK
ncbi:thioesterase [Staphylococcus chromogenes]|uniref:PaaI family thioesterase n=1 Tax=Staphylococcus chromogenes TaxID=46126 RepID=UPI000D1A1109|nr:PaaI family thioesterase [Staphylococcus chromogenes]MCE4965345.1 PaaI family thioesterase [Staphylococcus chromogenes]MDT0693047.1 PaaI family thioesterase [Staphylococcus chromogenes]MDT0699468.1 PaaI family thioesterase [Staphylococcus chromogenes]MDU0450997.1 PaaI family thioesterase [Staphylococcus chromogenes]PTF76675.1 thioesterase [Staphylococcus chromogenes]